MKVYFVSATIAIKIPAKFYIPYVKAGEDKMSIHIRLLSLLSALLLFSALAVGCNLFNKDGKTTPQNQTQSEDQTQNGQDTTIQNPEDAETNTSQTGTGVYQGQIDSNSVEIEVNKGTEKVPTAFQLSEELKRELAETDLGTGDKVTFTYETSREGQPLLTEIAKQE